ncbi:lantibiotic dehydratase [Streptomyces sp. NPDC054834]
MSAATLFSAREADDFLHRLIGRLPAGEESRAAVRLRRRIRAKPTTPVPEQRAEDAQLPDVVACWQKNALAYADALTDFAAQAAAESDRERAVLAGLCGNSTFASSLALVSPDLDLARLRYAAHAGRTRRADRKSEPRLLGYAHRAMLRTSPRSQFTAVCLGPLTDSPDHGDRPGGRRAVPVVRQRSVDLQRGPLLAVGEALLRETPGQEPDFVRLAPLVAAGRGRLGFLRTGAGATQSVTVRRTAQVDALVGLARFGVHARHDLIRRLARRLGCPEDAAASVLRAVLPARLLVPALPVDEQSATFADDLAAALRSYGPAAEPLARLGGITRALAEDDPTRRRPLVEQFRDTCRELPRAAALGVQIYEDTLAEPEPPPAPRTALAACAALLPVLRAFDLKTDLRLGLHDAVRHLGPRLSITEAAEDLAAHAAHAAGAPGRMSDPRLAACLGEVREYRRAVLTDLAELLASLPPGQEAVLGEELVACWRRSLPEWLDGSAASYAAMLQEAPGGLWVCNGIHAGTGVLLARFLRLDAQAGGDARSRLRVRLRELLGPAVAEDRACHGVNTGVHPPLLDHAMTPDDWAGAVIEDTAMPGRPRLFTPDGRRPVVIASTRWDLLPAPSRIASWLQGGGLVQPAYDQVYRGRTVGGDGVLRVPRIRYGTLVLQRARWYLPDLSRLADAATGTTAALRQLLDMAARYGVPDEVFCKQLQQWQHEAASAPDFEAPFPRLPKPRYVHLAGSLGLRALARDAAEFSRPYLEECLPEPVEAEHVREHVYEFDRREETRC